MAIQYSHVRKRSNHDVVIKAGYSDFTGQFDSAVYEQVLGKPPQNATFESEQPIGQKLKDVFNSIPVSLIDKKVRGHFRILEAGVTNALNAPIPDMEAAKSIIEEATMPDGSPLTPQLKTLQDTLLMEFL